MPTATQQRVTILLDVRIPLEALILNRLTRLPAERRTDWLRCLLVTGFSSECRAIKSQTALPQRLNRGDFERSEPRRLQTLACQRPSTQADLSLRTSDQDSLVRPQVDDSADHTKPFAHLKSVIGQ